MSFMLKKFPWIMVIACCSPAYGQLSTEISVETAQEPEGRWLYEYLVENLDDSPLSINAFVLDVGPGADVVPVDQPADWVDDYAPEQDPFELGWAALTTQAAIPVGGSGTFSFTSPLEPGDIDYFLVHLAPDGSDLGNAFGQVAGPLVTPTVVDGDYNDNGRVEQGDLDLVLLNWGAPFAALPAEWTNQRPSMGIVDQAELDGVLLNWGNTASAAAVPEPATWIPAMLACFAAWRLRRRMNRG